MSMGSRHHEDSIRRPHSNHYHETRVSHHRIRDRERNSPQTAPKQPPSKDYPENDRNNMCHYHHEYHFCPCRNANCKTPSGVCCKDFPPSKSLAQGQEGHFLAKCTVDDGMCDAWVDEQTKPGTPFGKQHCPKFVDGDKLKVVDLCKQCRKDCAGKQT